MKTSIITSIFLSVIINISSHASACDEPSKPDMERINKILVNSGLSKKTEGKRYIVCYEYTSYVSGICVVLENPGYFTIYNIDRTSNENNLNIFNNFVNS